MGSIPTRGSGVLAHQEEHRLCKPKAVGSSPTSSTHTALAQWQRRCTQNTDVESSNLSGGTVAGSVPVHKLVLKTRPGSYPEGSTPLPAANPLVVQWKIRRLLSVSVQVRVLSRGLDSAISIPDYVCLDQLSPNLSMPIRLTVRRLALDQVIKVRILSRQPGVC